MYFVECTPTLIRRLHFISSPCFRLLFFFFVLLLLFNFVVKCGISARRKKNINGTCHWFVRHVSDPVHSAGEGTKRIEKGFSLDTHSHWFNDGSLDRITNSNIMQLLTTCSKLYFLTLFMLRLRTLSWCLSLFVYLSMMMMLHLELMPH